MRPLDNLCGHSVFRFSSVQFLYIPNFPLNIPSFNSSSSSSCRITCSSLSFNGSIRNRSSNSSNSSSSMSRSSTIKIRIFFLVSATSLTTCPVSFNFTQQTGPKILLLHPFDILHTERACSNSFHLPRSKFHLLLVDGTTSSSICCLLVS
jgi:hypothetical protein